MKKPRTLVIGDIHGGHKALLQCFERSSFDMENEELIVLGDVCDGWPETRECVDELLKIKNLVYVLGNHDAWAYSWAKHNDRENLWISQGGWNTVKSYNFKMPQEHIEFFERGNLWVEDEEKDILFVHGGIDPQTKVDNQPTDVLLWDRTLMHVAWNKRKKEGHTLTPYKEVFIGHTSTVMYGTDKPIHACNIWNLDTGGGWHGKLTIMDLDTRKYWQSDSVTSLYPNSSSRDDYSKYNEDVRKWLKNIN